LIAVKHFRHKGFRQIHDRLTYSRKVPWETNHQQVGHGRNITWTLRAMRAPDWVIEQ
jgi:hypothetical protein